MGAHRSSLKAHATATQKLATKNSPAAAEPHPFWIRWIQTSMLWLFHILIFLTPFLFTFVTDELFEFNKMVFVYLVAILVGSLWAVRSVLERKFIFRKTPLDWAIGTFFASQLLATVFSLHLQTSLFGYYSRFHGGLLSLISYVVLYYAFVSTITKRQLTGLLVTLLVTASLVSLYAVPEHFHVSPSCVILQQSFTTDCWSANTNPKYRIFGTFGQPNWLAAYAVLILPIAIAAAVTKSTTPKLRSLGGVTSILLFLTVLFTESRSGLLGLLLSAGVFFFGFIWWWWQQRTDSVSLLREVSTRAGASIAAVLLLAAVVFGTVFTPSLSELFKSSQNQPLPTETAPQPLDRLEAGGTDSGEIRKIVWEGAVKVWERYPLFGSGVETFAYSYYLDRPQSHNLVSEWDFLYNKAHNEFLNYLATTGAVGLLAYIALLGSFAVTSLRIVIDVERSLRERVFSLSLLAGVAALTVSNFFGFSTVTVTMLMFLFFAAVARISQGILENTPEHTSKRVTSKRTASASLHTWQYLCIGVIVFLGGSLCIRTIEYWYADYYFAEGKKYIGAGYSTYGIAQLQQALSLSPAEPTYYMELGEAYAQAALEQASAGNATATAQLTEAAVVQSTIALTLNPHQLNFYKSYAQILIRLSPLQPQFLPEAEIVLEKAQTLAPTDPRIMYNRSLVAEAQGNEQERLKYLKETIALKPDYVAARLRMAQYYTAQAQYASAAAEYQYLLDFVAPNDPNLLGKLSELEASMSATPSQ